MGFTDYRGYPLVEHFGSLQGEGSHCTLGAYFLRLGGCNVGCEWCDSPGALSASGVERYDAQQIAGIVVESGAQSAVITGGEPTIHNLEPLTTELHRNGIEVWMETSGTNPLQGQVDWITLSPKPWMEPLDEFYAVAGELKCIVGDEEDLEFAKKCAEKCADKCNEKALLYLQPEWGNRHTAVPLILRFIEQNPQWRLSVQTHKYLGIL